MKQAKSWPARILAIVMVLAICLVGLTFCATPTASTVSIAAQNVGAVDALAKLKTQISDLSSSSFVSSGDWSGQRDALLSEVDAAISQAKDGSYQGALDKIDKDIKGKIREWIVKQDQSKLVEAADVASASVTNASKTTVQIASGKVAGADAGNNSWVWKGIPYAKPPVGDLRWRAPQDPVSWMGVRHSTDSFDACAQPPMVETLEPQQASQNNVIGSEDCLYLNVFSPKSDAKDLPVYFWIHGGSNTSGDAKYYDGSIIASRSDMVVVVIQYRLGPFGFFNHPALKVGATPEESSGNFGILDAIKALRWVHDNIRAFGGNPDNVTIAGESAGAHDVMNLLISPLAKGLFHRAISESGGMTIVSVASGIQLANSTIEKLLIADGTVPDEEAAAKYRENMTSAQIASYLRGKEPGQLIQAQMRKIGAIATMDAHSAYEDGVVIPGSLLSVIASGNYNRVPVILGSNEYETKLFLPLFGGTIPTSSGKHWFDLYKVLNGQLTLDQVMPLQSDRDPYEACGYYGARNWKVRYVDSVARALKEKQDDVYCYFFRWGGPGSGPEPFDFIYGAAHAMDISFFFGLDSSRIFPSAFTEQNRPGRVQLQKDMMVYVAQFAATGNPNGQRLTEWQKWSNTAGEPKCIVFDASYTEAKISMMTTELTFEGVRAEVNALPDRIKAFVLPFLW